MSLTQIAIGKILHQLELASTEMQEFGDHYVSDTRFSEIVDEKFEEQIIDAMVNSGEWDRRGNKFFFIG